MNDIAKARPIQASIEDGLLCLQVDLLIPNGEVVALGFLAKAQAQVLEFFKQKSTLKLEHH